MAKVIERFSTSVDEEAFIHHDDRLSSYAAAEALHGQRLDHRKRYAIIGGGVCELIRYKRSCSGCSEDAKMRTSDKGSGCHECGYTGTSRQSTWVPMSSHPELIAINAGTKED